MDSVITISPTIATRLSNLERFTLIRLCFTGALLCGAEACGVFCAAGEGVEAAGASPEAAGTSFFYTDASETAGGAEVATACFTAAFSITS